MRKTATTFQPQTRNKNVRSPEMSITKKIYRQIDIFTCESWITFFLVEGA